MRLSVGKVGKKRALTALLVFFALLGFAALLLTPKGFFNKPEPVVSFPIQSVEIAMPTQIAELILYKIKTEDTLTKIAKLTCNTIDELASRNNVTNPNKIFAGQNLVFLKVESCSPELVKSKTFPKRSTGTTPNKTAEKESLTQHGIGASHAPKQDVTTKEPLIKIETPIHLVQASKNGCKNVGTQLRNFAEKTLARAECIKQNYGEIIKEGIATIDERVPHLEVVARMIIESKGNPFALNEQSNCKGLMQLQPGTAKQYGVDLQKIYDPRENIFGGIRVISHYTYHLFGGDTDRGRVAYNAGPYNRLFRRQNFDPSRFAYVREVQEVLTILDEHQFTL